MKTENLSDNIKAKTKKGTLSWTSIILMFAVWSLIKYGAKLNESKKNEEEKGYVKQEQFASGYQQNSEQQNQFYNIKLIHEGIDEYFNLIIKSINNTLSEEEKTSLFVKNNFDKLYTLRDQLRYIKGEYTRLILKYSKIRDSIGTKDSQLYKNIELYITMAQKNSIIAQELLKK